MKMTMVQYYYVEVALNGDILSAVVVFPWNCKRVKSTKKQKEILPENGR